MYRYFKLLLIKIVEYCFYISFIYRSNNFLITKMFLLLKISLLIIISIACKGFLKLKYSCFSFA